MRKWKDYANRITSMLRHGLHRYEGIEENRILEGTHTKVYITMVCRKCGKRKRVMYKEARLK